MAIEIATLTRTTNANTINLPSWFNYVPYLNAKKRIKVTKTSKGSFSQISLPLFLHGTEYISWEIEVASPEIVEQLNILYVLTEKLTFDGFWNDSYLVEFSEFEVTPKSGYFQLKGKFRVVCVNSHFAPSC